MKDIMLIVNDVHLRLDNIDTVMDIMLQAAEKALSLSLSTVYVAGDFFDTRASQKLAVLKAFGEILDMYEEIGVGLVMIHGNHDLSSYSDTYSWISPFKEHKSLRLISEPEELKNIGGVTVSFLPFQDEDMMIKSIDSMSEADILIAHFELNGSISNGIAAKDRAISVSMLKKFGMVLLGHYHDSHYVADNVFHMPSAYQRNFAEDSKKGFTVVSSDMSIRHEQSVFRPFKTVTLNVDEDIAEDTRKLIKEANNNDKNIRVKLEGSQAGLNSFKKDKFKLVGIDIKVNHDKIFNSETGELEEVKIQNIDISESFRDFCENEGISLEEGLKYLTTK